VYGTADPAQSTNSAPTRTMFEAHHCFGATGLPPPTVQLAERTAPWPSGWWGYVLHPHLRVDLLGGRKLFRRSWTPVPEILDTCSGNPGHPFRTILDTCSGNPGHPFRTILDTRSGDPGHPFRRSWTPVPAILDTRSGDPGHPFRRSWTHVPDNPGHLFRRECRSVQLGPESLSRIVGITVQPNLLTWGPPEGTSREAPRSLSRGTASLLSHPRMRDEIERAPS
jgi:hypothetical protein